VAAFGQERTLALPKKLELSSPAALKQKLVKISVKLAASPGANRY